MKRRGGMKRKKDFRQRIRAGEIGRKDVRRLLAELACGKVNDCVRLALEEAPCLEELDLRLLGGVKRSENGTVEVKLIDRLKILEQLAEVAQEDGAGMEAFLQEMQGGEGK